MRVRLTRNVNVLTGAELISPLVLSTPEAALQVKTQRDVPALGRHLASAMSSRQPARYRPSPASTNQKGQATDCLEETLAPEPEGYL
jgi:hypothetical protein